MKLQFLLTSLLVTCLLTTTPKVYPSDPHPGQVAAFVASIVTGGCAAKIFLRKKDGFGDFVDCMVKSTALGATSFALLTIATKDN